MNPGCCVGRVLLSQKLVLRMRAGPAHNGTPVHQVWVDELARGVAQRAISPALTQSDIEYNWPLLI
jgi:hypothetical protein